MSSILLQLYLKSSIISGRDVGTSRLVYHSVGVRYITLFGISLRSVCSSKFVHQILILSYYLVELELS
jgi:hypothetical protein